MDASSLEVKLAVPKEGSCAGEWVPLQLAITRPVAALSPVQLLSVSSSDPGVQFDLDLLDRFLEIRPGETYRVTVPIKVAAPRTLELSSIDLELKDLNAKLTEKEKTTLMPLPAKLLELQPSLRQMVKVEVNAICQYDDGTKVHAVVRHVGAEALHDLTLTVMSSQELRAGKRTLVRETFLPGAEERLDWVVGGASIELHATATVGGRRAERRWTEAVTAPAGQREQRFRFLEPRRLSADLVTVLEQTGGGEEKRAVASEHGVHRLHGHGRYVVEIRPHRADATNVELREVQGQIHVRQRDPQNKVWRFTIDVQMHDLFRKQETLYYDVAVPGETLSGEIPVCLCPPSVKHWQVASYLGAALTLQGVSAVGRLVYQSEVDLLHILSEIFSADHRLDAISAISIFVGWIGLNVIDTVQYRLKS